jgi:hypothetical protein
METTAIIVDKITVYCILMFEGYPESGNQLIVMKATDTLTGAILPPLEVRRVGAPYVSRRHAMRMWRAWSAWSALESIPYVGTSLFSLVFVWLSLARGSDIGWESSLYENLSPFLFGQWWWTGIVACFVAAYCGAVAWKLALIRFHYQQCTPVHRRRKKLGPAREPLVIL